MEKIKNLSINKTIILYMSVSLLCSFLMSALIIQTATVTQQQIWWKYVNEEKYMEDELGKNRNYEVSPPRVGHSEMRTGDARLSELCDFLQTYTVLILSILGSCIAVGLFYRNKLKTPLEELDKASKMIAEGALDFHITYENQDEMGQLCKQFEKMRMQLEQNNRAVWHIVEDEKALRAAIAHDIRSPLAVLKGYQEMLLEFIPDEMADPDQIKEMLLEGMQQIERMNRFIETMRKMTKLEERPLQFTDTDTEGIGRQIRKEAEMLCKGTGKTCTVIIEPENQKIRVDTEIVLEVVENLLSNAFRFAAQEISMVIEAAETELSITVRDDGNGFKVPADTATKAFYHANPQDDLQHFGMGMYISRVYCEKHDGRLLVSNQSEGGAAVRAVFRLDSKAANRI